LKISAIVLAAPSNLEDLGYFVVSSMVTAVLPWRSPFFHGDRRTIEP
jgi:hypothetical protein